MKRTTWMILATTCALSACDATGPVYDIATAPASEMRTASDVGETPHDWGASVDYFKDKTPIVDDTLVAVVKLDAGREAHAPHKHVEEEYIYVLEGRGEWYLNGETFPAKEGDTLYARSWDYHGITADADAPLDFIIFKYTGTGVAMPEDPDPSQPLEIID